MRKFHREKKRRRVASLDIIIKYFILIFKAHPTCAWYIVVHLVGFGGQQQALAKDSMIWQCDGLCVIYDWVIALMTELKVCERLVKQGHDLQGRSSVNLDGWQHSLMLGSGKRQFWSLETMYDCHIQVQDFVRGSHKQWGDIQRTRPGEKNMMQKMEKANRGRRRYERTDKRKRRNVEVLDLAKENGQAWR